MAVAWNTDAVSQSINDDTLIRVTMPVTVMDDIFDAVLEVVWVDGQWLLNESYLAKQTS